MAFYEAVNYSAWHLIVRLIQEMAVAKINKSDAESFKERSLLLKFKEGENFNRRNTFKYFEDRNLSLTKKSGKRGRYAKLSYYATDAEG